MNLTPPLESTNSLWFSYPINYEYPNSISFSGVHAGFLMAYGSSNLIIVLIEGKHISAVLKGHKKPVCNVTFEVRGPHILSCDTSGLCYFWYYQDSIWQNSRIVQLPNPIISASWYTSRKKICYSCKDGLYYCSLTDFGTKAEKLCEKSNFCTFNFDGTLLASHNNGYILSIFMLSNNTYLTQFLKHPSKIATFDFHPSLPSFLTITKDHILRIWRQSILSCFACTSVIKVPFTGYFVKNPFFYSDSSAFGPQKSTKIKFVDCQNNFYKLKIKENGLIKNSQDENPFRNSTASEDFGFRAVYKTNLGTEHIIVSKDKISIVSRHQKRQLLFHNDVISSSEFAPESFWLFTLDVSGRLILWPIFNPYHSSKEISTKATFAVWKDSNVLVFHEEKGGLKLYDTLDDEIRSLDFPPVESPELLYSSNGEIFAITSDRVISAKSEHRIDEYQQVSASKTFDGHFVLLFSNESNQLSGLLCPEMKRIPCASRSGKIKSVCFLSMVLFAVLTESDVEFWNYKSQEVGYELSSKVYLPGMIRLYADASILGGRLLAFDDKHLFSVSNGVNHLMNSPDITNIAVSSVGHIAIFHEKNFQVYPSWCINMTNKSSKASLSRVSFSQSDELLTVGNLSQDAKFIQKISLPPSINYMISPLVYINPPNSSFLLIQSTLFHLLECKIINKIDKCTPEQIPAVPNQYAFPSALEFPEDFDQPEYRNLIDQIKNVHEDIDMFGLRYLLAIKENAWPPSYFALWLSFSQRQSQVAEHLISFVDTNMLSKFYIPVSIHQHSVLVKIVQHALSNMWISYQKVDNVALLYAALGQVSAISKLYSAVGDDLRAEFFKSDFKKEKMRKKAIRNAYSSLSHHGMEMSATLFLVAGDIDLCINIIATKMDDPMLAFLVLRLITHSDYSSSIIQKFLKNVNWDDEIISVLISNLVKDGKISDLLEKLILEKEMVKNLTAFGDRRITLFQLYFNLTKKRDILGQLVTNMNQDGLAPLASYVYGIANCPYETFRSIEIDEAEADEKLSEEEEEKQPLIKIDDQITIEKAKDFDFGGSGFVIDDFDDESDWSNDDDDDKEEDNDKSNENSKEENADDKVLDAKSKEPVEQGILDAFLFSMTNSLCRFFGKSDSDAPDEYAGSFAMRASSIKAASRLLPQPKRNILFQQISFFIDNCCSLFYESASIPLTPQLFMDLVLKFFRAIVRYEMAKEIKIHPEPSVDSSANISSPSTSNSSLISSSNNNSLSSSNINLLSASNNNSLSASNNNSLSASNNNSLSASNNNSLSASNNNSLSASMNANSNENGNKNENENNELVIEKSNGSDNVTIQNQKSLLTPNGEITKNNPFYSSLDIKKILQYRNYDFIHSVFNGAVAIATWTYFPQFLAKLLDESIETVDINCGIIPQAKSFFDVDITSPRFPDSIPSLLTRYNKGSDQVASFERSRFLIMFLLFQRILAMNKKLLNQDDEYKYFINKMEERNRSMLKTFQFYEVALGKPLLEEPLPDDENSCDPISKIIDKVFVDNFSDLQTIHNNSLDKQVFPPIYRKGKLSVSPCVEIRNQYGFIKSMALMPHEKEKLIAVAGNQLITVDLKDLQNPEIKPFNLGPQNQNFSDMIEVIANPTFDLFICLMPNSAYMFLLNNQMAEKCKICVSLSSSKISCAAFSPNTAKFAICSTVLDIFTFDASKYELKPTDSRPMKGQITAVTWINSETSLVVAYNNASSGLGGSNSSSLVVINTLMKYDQPIEVKKEWGVVTSLAADIRKGKLVFGTKNGYIVINDINKNFENSYTLQLGVSINSIANLQELVVAGTDNGKIIVFSSSKPKNSSQLETSYKINSVILNKEMIIAAGDAPVFSIWNAL